MKTTPAFLVSLACIAGLAFTALPALAVSPDEEPPAIEGTYYVEGAVADYQGTRSFTIGWNTYRERVVVAEGSFEAVAYYDRVGHELFCVIAGQHQFNTLMKFHVSGDRLTVFSLVGEAWFEYPATYKKTRDGD